MDGPRKSWNNYSRRAGGGFPKQSARPLFSVAAAVTSRNTDGVYLPWGQQQTDKSFTPVSEPDSYLGWKLYFPEKGKFDDMLNNFKLKFSFSFQGILRSCLSHQGNGTSLLDLHAVVRHNND